MFRIIFTSIGIVVGAVLTVGVVTITSPTIYAQTPSAPTEQPTGEQAPSRAENRKQITAARCTIAESKIDTQIQRLIKVSEKTDGSFEKAIDKANTYLASAEAKKYPNIDALKTSLATVTSSFESLQSSHDTYITALTETKNYACGESEGDYVKALSNARTSLIDVRTNRATTRANIVTKLIPEMKAYLTWLKSTNQEEL